MITGSHAIVYAQDATRARAFFRDTLRFPHVDAGDGWLIFALPPAEVGVHPDGGDSGRHELYLVCDDVVETVASLQAKGVEFTKPIQDFGWGLMATLRIHGGGEMGLYQPRHARPKQAAAARSAGRKPATPKSPARKAKRNAAKATKRKPAPKGKAPAAAGRGRVKR